MDEQQKSSSSKINFSIEHILKFAGKSVSYHAECDNNNRNESLVQQNSSFPHTTLSWLSCTRYCPPRIPRVQKESVLKKRRIGRQARIPFTSEQLKTLEDHFQRTPYLNAIEVKQISAALQLGDNRVKIWFQNRRARERRDRCGNYERPENSRDNIISIPPSFELTNTSLITESMPTTSRTNININKSSYETQKGVSLSGTNTIQNYSLLYTSNQPPHQAHDYTNATFNKYSSKEHPM